MNPLENQFQIYTFHPKQQFPQKIAQEKPDQIQNQLQKATSISYEKDQKQIHLAKNKTETQKEHKSLSLNAQIQIDTQASSNFSPQFQPSFKLKAMFFYLYFLQGIVLSMASTMPYVYKQLPNYDTMAIFSLTILPFSLKFLTAPFIEKYNNVNYGKRKTWIVLSQIMTSIMVFLASYFTQFQDSRAMAFFLFFTVFCICLQDIALDGLAIKQLKVPHIASLMQAVGQMCGAVIGSLLLLKFTSGQFADSINLEEPITSCSFLFKSASFIILIPTMVFHLSFKQNVLQSEKQIAQMPFKKVLRQYKIFLKTGSRYFRTSVLVLIYVQGINFFLAGYQYELIQSGFSRNDLNTISNIAVIPIGIATCLMTSKIETKIGIDKSILYVLCGYIITIFFVLLFFPKQYFIVAIITVCMDVLGTWLFLVNSILNTSYPVTELTGMYLTMLACVSNFGKFCSIHTMILGEFGWVKCSIFGLLIQAVIVYKLKDILRWVQEGSYNCEDQKVKLSIQEQENTNLRQVSQSNLFGLEEAHQLSS